jgi:ketosteroid isomerase-like protein
MENAIRDLVEEYAAAVDRRDFDSAVGLFTADAVMIVPDMPKSLSPSLERRGHDAIREALMQVNSCLHTLHAVVTHRATVRDHDAVGRTACLAHHVISTKSGPEDFVWAIQYDDTFVVDDDLWKFTSRSVRVDWVESRPVRLVR